MDPGAMIPHGLAIRAYSHGEADAQLVVRRDDGVEERLPAGVFFRSPADFTAIENAALQSCRGQVLDAGAGTGLHSVVLQSRGLAVTAIDISPEAVAIMVDRGIHDVHVADILRFRGGPYDTLLMLGHGIGMVEDLGGLNRFLSHARTLLRGDGQMLLHSLDVRRSQNPGHLAYQEANRRAGRYAGEVRIQFEFRGTSGPYCGWLHVDPKTLGEAAARHGWRCATLLEEESGEHLSRLVPARPRGPGSTPG